MAIDDGAAVAFAEFVEAIRPAERVLVFHDADADGVTAGVVLAAALARLGCERVTRRSTDRERDAWSAPNHKAIASEAPDVLFLLDLGSRDEPLCATARVCLIDHHRPEGVPPGALLISSYAWDPIPNTSLLVYDLCSRLTDVSDLDWIAAIGVVSDLGERAPFPILASMKGRHTMKDLREATSLVNAARRASRFAPEVAAAALESSRSPRELVQSASREVEALRAARDEFQRELAEAKRAAPVFAGNVALVRVRSQCQVHPVIAQIWRARLPKYIVIVANDGYLPGRVNFSMRAAGTTNLLDFLAKFDLGEGEGSYGRGHDQATGGSLPAERWERLLSQLGFAQGTTGPR